MDAGYEILEHTADVGLRAWGASPEEAFEQAGWALAEILGAAAEGLPGVSRRVRAEADDLGALAVAFLDELLFLHESEEAGFAAIRVSRVGERDLQAEVGLTPLLGEPEGTAVKAATYHQLDVRRDPGGATELTVYLDV
ncbi:MAG: archease [Actinomycetota bacterium]|nr:archease [Actinomycetota bacterium]